MPKFIITGIAFLYSITSFAQKESPMACHVQAQVITILPLDKTAGIPCGKYPCRAKVKIKKVSACGSSVSALINPNDTLDVKFAYTLHATSKLFPRMKVHYPGLKKGSIFTANIEQRVKMGSGNEFIVFDYSLITNTPKNK